MSKVNQSASDVFDSLTGFDEMSITQHFGRTISELAPDPTMWARALVFVTKRRDGSNDDDARNHALEMPLAGVTDYFADESEESGKDEPVDEPQPESSLSSVS